MSEATVKLSKANKILGEDGLRVELFKHLSYFVSDLQKNAFPGMAEGNNIRRLEKSNSASNYQER